MEGIKGKAYRSRVASSSFYFSRLNEQGRGKGRVGVEEGEGERLKKMA